MKRFTIILALVLSCSTYSLATDGYDSVNKEKISASATSTDVPYEQRSEEHRNVIESTLNAEPSTSSRSAISVIRGLSNRSTSLLEFLEYGMVPVEDLEAKLAEMGKIAKSGSPAKGKNKGKFYVINASANNSDGDKDSNDSEEEEEEDDDDDDDDDEDDGENSDD